MYLDAIILNHNRKERPCKECKRAIEPGTDNLMLMCRGRKGGRYYVYLHPCCVLTMLWRERERRRVKDRKASGRPAGSGRVVLSPELAKERHKLIRARARLIRLLVVEEDEDRICELVTQARRLKGRITEILPLQVEKPGHRSAESVRIVNEKVDRAKRTEVRRRREGHEKRQETVREAD